MSRDVQIKITAVDKTQLVFGRVGRHLKTLARDTKVMATQFRGLGSAMASVGRKASVMFTAMSAGGAVAGTHMVGVAASFEQMELKLNALTKGKGKETLQAINQWALDMPVNTQKAVDAYVTMMAMGLDPTLKKMTTLVDVAAMMGEDALPRVSRALGQMATLGKLSAEELNQLSEVGINARKYLSAAFGGTVEDIQKQGIAINDIIEVIWQGLDRDFGGSAIAAMGSWQGLKATFVSYVTEIERAVMNAGVFDAMKGALAGINAELQLWLANNQEWIKQEVPEHLEKVKNKLTALYTAFTSVPSVVYEAGAYGLIGSWLFGGKIGAIIAALTMVNATMGKISGGSASIGGMSKDLQDFWTNMSKIGEWMISPVYSRHKQYPGNEKEPTMLQIPGMEHEIKPSGVKTAPTYREIAPDGIKAVPVQTPEQYQAHMDKLAAIRKSITPIIIKHSQSELAAEEWAINQKYDAMVVAAKGEKALIDEISKARQIELDGLGAKYSETTNQIKRMQQSLAGTIEGSMMSALSSLLDGTKSFGDAMKDIFKSIIMEIIRLTVVKKIAGSIAGAIFPAKAAGGPVEQGTPYMVGEKGPELFMPGKSGTIIPNHKLKTESAQPATASAPVTVNVNISAVDARSFNDMTKRNPSAIVAPIIKALQGGDRGLRSTLQGALA